MQQHSLLDSILDPLKIQLTDEPSTPISGGCIANSKMLTDTQGKNYFLKEYEKEGIAPSEANSLEALHELLERTSPELLCAPKPLGFNSNQLLLAWIDSKEPNAESFHRFGRGLALMHKETQSAYGFNQDNYLGLSPQKNTPSYKSDSWAEFFIQMRLEYQLQLIQEASRPHEEIQEALETKLPVISKHLAHSSVFPSLLHGDLWQGNFLISQDSTATLIDPACYWGHREADLAMCLLFGGFPQEFYNGYEQEFAMQSGSAERIKIYQLYQVMNHYTLFGGSYGRQACQLLEKL